MDRSLKIPGTRYAAYLQGREFCHVLDHIPPDLLLAALTTREREYIIVRCGLPEPTGTQIADTMKLAVRSLEDHQQKVFEKLDVSTTHELVYMAQYIGLVPCDCERMRRAREDRAKGGGKAP